MAADPEKARARKARFGERRREAARKLREAGDQAGARAISGHRKPGDPTPKEARQRVERVERQKSAPKGELAGRKWRSAHSRAADGQRVFVFNTYRRPGSPGKAAGADVMRVLRAAAKAGKEVTMIATRESGRAGKIRGGEPMDAADVLAEIAADYGGDVWDFAEATCDYPAGGGGGLIRINVEVLGGLR